MSATGSDLDLRVVMTPETHAALQAMKARTGQSLKQCCEMVLHGWALQWIEAAEVLNAHLVARNAPAVGSGSYRHRVDAGNGLPRGGVPETGV
jgi:hypothetical protein